MKKARVPLYIFFVILLSELCDAFAQFCFKKSAMSQESIVITNVGEAFSFIFTALHSGYLGLGIAMATLMLVLWLTVLSKVDLSIAMPLTSCSYVFVALASMIFLNEHISLLRWLGILFILTGVVIVTKSAGSDVKIGRPEVP